MCSTMHTKTREVVLIVVFLLSELSDDHRRVASCAPHLHIEPPLGLLAHTEPCCSKHIFAAPPEHKEGPRGYFQILFLFFFQGARPLQRGGGANTRREIKNAPPWRSWQRRAAAIPSGSASASQASSSLTALSHKMFASLLCRGSGRSNRRHHAIFLPIRYPVRSLE